eukprot:CAMPEP_0184656196 /NCGR_PEP_ID=MMETSP0308-20130426/15947_1 /TAXON_ID=38269 /ORGANISM="Gloeochaete witrockiana, Strain SAG 46.84" /LENGTH=222 /DNA_ID=CAMNT_0027093197 /DNA_START=143 /DNA_END=811 /DNA_ORIENTATION=-
MPPPSDIVVKPKQKHTATVIFLHGLGDTGHGWADVAPDFQAAVPYCKFIFPTAQVRPVTLNGGMPMPAWFDILGLSDSSQEDEKGIEEAGHRISSMIEAEVKAGVPANRIVVGGFSQGGVISLYTALMGPNAIAGVVALSCWLPLAEKIKKVSLASRKLAIFQAHGDSDPLVRLSWGQATNAQLKAIGAEAEFHLYRGMAHSACPQEMEDIAAFLKKTLPPV